MNPARHASQLSTDDQASTQAMVAGILEKITVLNKQLQAPAPGPAAPQPVRRPVPPPGPHPMAEPIPVQPSPTLAPGSGDLRNRLEAIGFHPHVASQLERQIPSGQDAEDKLEQFLIRQWPTLKENDGRDSAFHVLIGPSGSGKTTALSKWVSQRVLGEDQAARVWRLDGGSANMAESLDVLCQALGIECDRVWEPDKSRRNPSMAQFVDLPGVDWKDPVAIQQLQERITELGHPHPRIHLVLNAAYETRWLFDQIHAFSGLEVADLIFTHLDEDPRPAKIWNFVLGTKHAVSGLSIGQNVPGEFRKATPESLLPLRFV